MYLHSFTRENSAIDIGCGTLRRCILMAALQQSRDASGAEHAVIAAIPGNDCLRSGVIGVLGQGHHGFAQLVSARRAGLGK